LSVRGSAALLAAILESLMVTPHAMASGIVLGAGNAPESEPSPVREVALW